MLQEAGCEPETATLSHRHARIRTVGLCVLLTLCSALPGKADDSFYKGKTITFIIPTGTGGGYDTYSRVLARHIGRFLPGQPAVVAQNMPGAAGVRAANYLFNVAVKDGTVIGMVDQAVALDHTLQTPGLTADPVRFNWIGRLISNSAVLYAWHTARVQKIEDVFSHELIVSTSGAASRLNWTVLNNLVGTKFKIITGYKGTTDSRLAMLRGEVEALSQPWAVLKVDGAQLLAEKKINLLLQTGIEKNSDLPELPRMIELAKNEDDRRLLALFSSPSTVGRSVVAPPGVPAERVAALRQAFTTAIHDPALLNEARQLKLELDPLDGAALQAENAKSGSVPAELVARARRVAER
jgi:tripartite-type tricarboxylate transporter receptor subunit TctC